MFCTFLGVIPPFVLSPDAASLFSFCFLSPSVSCFPLPFFSSLSLTGSEWDVAYHCIIRAIFSPQSCLKTGMPVSERAFLFRGELAETAWSHQHKPKWAFMWDVTFTPCYSWEMVTALISRSFSRNQCWETLPWSWWAPSRTIKDPHLALPLQQPPVCLHSCSCSAASAHQALPAAYGTELWVGLHGTWSTASDRYCSAESDTQCVIWVGTKIELLWIPWLFCYNLIGFCSSPILFPWFGA